MTLYAGISALHVNSYHDNNGLLFQFILVEFTASFTEIQRLEALSCRTPIQLLESEFSCKKMEASHQAEDSLKKLVGSMKSCPPFFSWSFREGLLSKLRTYCALFLQNAEREEKEFLAIQHYADKVWQGCLQAIEVLKESPQDRSALLMNLDKVNSAMQRLAKLIARLIHQFRDDENVMYYVVRHHKTFDKLYGHRFVTKLIGKMYPKGLKEVQYLLIKKYTERGFEHLIPSIYTAINEIEAASL